MLQLSDSPRGPVDVDYIDIYEYVYASKKMSEVKYPPSKVGDICKAIVKWTEFFGLRTSFVAAQILHETGFFTFGGDVVPEQNNFAGLGTTGGGVRGHSFPTVDAGVLAVCVHHLGYIFGRPSNWPLLFLPFESADPRLPALLASGKAGSVQTIADYGGKWAVDKGYSGRVLLKANALLELAAKKKDTTIPIKIAISAGHHNSSGGNADEFAIVGELCEEYYTALTYQGFDVRSITPDGPDADDVPGDGMFQGDLFVKAQQVVRWRDAGWAADYYIELHTEGGPKVPGMFGIYPDWGNDVDVDARDTVIPRMIAKMVAATPITKRGTGLMSEKNTGVGRSGFRLGVFRATEPVKETCTRLLIEHGAHDTSDLQELRKPHVRTALARAAAEALCEIHKMPVKPWTLNNPAPVEPPAVESNPHLINGYWVIEDIYDLYTSLGDKAPYILGVPLSGMFLTNMNGTYRKVQQFSKCWVGVYEEGTPHGVPSDHPGRVRVLFPVEALDAYDDLLSRSSKW